MSGRQQAPLLLQEQGWKVEAVIDGRQDKNLKARKNKGLWIINQIMDILQSVFFGKYQFEVALVLRSSLFLSSILLNSEAWMNYSEKEIRSLEQTDEILLTRILDCYSKTSNAMKYLELGVSPLRFEIMRRTVLFLQYILQQEKKSMIFQVFQATCDTPTKNDFVNMCLKYLKNLQIKLSFHEIEIMSKFSFKKLVKEKTKMAAFKYLEEIKCKQSKILNIKYTNLEIQEYLLDGNQNTKMSKLIFKARSKTLDIKTQKCWKYEDKICIGCQDRVETGEEVLTCVGLGGQNVTKPVEYDWFYSEDVNRIRDVAKVLNEKLKIRNKKIENYYWFRCVNLPSPGTACSVYF